MALTAEDRIMNARIRLLMENMFFGYLLVRFKYEMTDLPMEAQPGDPPNLTRTFSVNANGLIKYNKQFVAKMTDDNVLAVLCHEVLHVALEHILRTPRRVRTEPRLHQIWNLAIDLVANAILAAEGFKLPTELEGMKGCGIVPKLDGANAWSYTFEQFGVTVTNVLKRTAEEVFHLLLRSLPQDLSNGMPGGFDSHEGCADGDPLDQEQTDKLAREWSGRVAEAAAAARSKGQLPGGLAGLLDKVAESKVNWRARLWQFVQSHAVSGFTWARPCRRALAIGVYLPSPYKENLELVLSADSSGSVSKECLARQIGEAQAIVQAMDNVKATMIISDAAIHEVFELDKFNVAAWLAQEHKWGRGGTSHGPVVDWILENKPEARLYVCMTDGYSDIETTFKRLPDSCHRLIMLAGNYKPESSFADVAETIVVEEDA